MGLVFFIAEVRLSVYKRLRRGASSLMSSNLSTYFQRNCPVPWKVLVDRIVQATVRMASPRDIDQTTLVASVGNQVLRRKRHFPG